MLWSDNSPTVVWVKRMVARGSKISIQLLRALTLRLKNRGASPLTPLHIQGKKNAMTDIPSRLFGSNPEWFYKTDSDFCNLFNENFTLPNQVSRIVFSPSRAVSMKVISILQMDHLEMGKWLQLKNSGKLVGKIGAPLSNLWEWTLGYRMPHTRK